MSSAAARVPAAEPQDHPAAGPAARPRLRTPVVLVGLFWLLYSLPRWLELVTFVKFLSAMAVCALMTLLFLIWWLRNRRIARGERLAGLAAAVVGGLLAVLLCQDTFGTMGVLLFGMPWVLTAWTAWLVVSRNLSARGRRLGLVAVLCLTWGFFPLVRWDGLTGEQGAELHWRWTPTAEEQYLRERAQAPRAEVAPGEALTLRAGDWPGFRGPGRDGVVRGLQIATDWKESPPRPLWRQRVGPAWSSVAVVDGRLFTQEQRGESEAVVCLDAATGKEVWARLDAIRFWESISGAGPRATPAFAEGRLFALGATGILNCLDAATGERHWWRDIAADSGAKLPTWGFCSSPLVVGGVVTVFAGGDGPGGLLAYHTDSGEPAWTAPAGQVSYTSPQPAALGGREQVLFFSDRGLTAVDPGSGVVLWEHVVAIPGAPRSIQPHPVGPGQVLIASEADFGTALLDVTHDGSWHAEQRWASRALKPSFNDFVVHEGHAYGFDGAAFTCIDLQTGQRRWRQRGYDHGQVLLLADQSLLLVVAEGGDAVLVKADPDKHQELGRFEAVRGKTWNHPAVAGGRLYVRNAEEMACYELAPAPRR
jgi:outer membrane protein assembly factor BamB